MPATKKNLPSSLSHIKTPKNDQLEAIKNLIESKFSQIEERISSVEQQIKSQNVEFASLISKIEEPTKAVLELGHVNSTKLKDNLDRADSNSFEVNHLKDQVSHLDEKMKKLTSELEDIRNRGLRKTLIFKNIPFQQQRHKESWDGSKEILAKEIIKVLPDFQVSDVLKK